MTDRDNPPQNEQTLAGIGSETNTGVPGLRKAVIDAERLAERGDIPEGGVPTQEDPLLKAAEQPLEGPDRTDLTEFYSDEVLEDDPTLTDRTEWSDDTPEEKLTIHDPEQELGA